MRWISTVACMALSIFAAPKTIAAESAHWEYDGEAGPEFWADIDEQYQVCRSGRNQSPVDLSTDFEIDLPKLIFDYKIQKTVHETNNGHTIQVDLEPGSFLRIEGSDTQFEAKQLHFHSPSEHTVGGQSFAMELHIVHTDANGRLGVVGILFREGDENSTLERIWAHMPEKAGQSYDETTPFAEDRLLPPTRDYYRYNGSLTTPPCSEGVTWIVLKNSIEASAEQIVKFQKTMGHATNRPLQPHNARMILK